MRSDFGKKIVLALHWLMSLALGISMIVLFFMDALPVKAHGAASIVFAIAALIVYLIFAAGALLISFPAFWRWKERNFVTISAGGLGRTRISVPALDQMIRKAMRGIDGIADMKTVIVNGDDSVEINVNIVLAAGAHVPTVTSDAQRAVRSYIEKNCGIEVSAVTVSVFSVQDEADRDSGKTVKRMDDTKTFAGTDPTQARTADPVLRDLDPMEAKTQDPILSDLDEWDDLTMDDAEESFEAGEEGSEADASVEAPGGNESVDAPAQSLSRSAKKRRRRKKKQAKLNAMNAAETDGAVEAEEADERAVENIDQASEAEAAEESKEEIPDAAEPMVNAEGAFDELDEPGEEAADAFSEEDESAEDAEDHFTEYEESVEPEMDYVPEDTYVEEYPTDDGESQKYND